MDVSSHAIPLLLALLASLLVVAAFVLPRLRKGKDPRRIIVPKNVRSSLVPGKNAESSLSRNQRSPEDEAAVAAFLTAMTGSGPSSPESVPTREEPRELPADFPDRLDATPLVSSTLDFLAEIEALGDNVAALAGKIGSDPLLAARILRAANTAHFSGGKRVDSLKYALQLLGGHSVKSLVVDHLLSGGIAPRDPSKGPLTSAVIRHSVFCATCASYLCGLHPGLDRGTLYTAGLLHDVGKLALIHLDMPHVQKNACLRPYVSADPKRNDALVWGYDHAAVGAMAAERWGLGPRLTALVGGHHLPLTRDFVSGFAQNEEARQLLVLKLANQLAKCIVSERGVFFVEPLPEAVRPLLDLDAVSVILTRSNLLVELVGISQALTQSEKTG